MIRVLAGTAGRHHLGSARLLAGLWLSLNELRLLAVHVHSFSDPLVSSHEFLPYGRFKEHYLDLCCDCLVLPCQ